MLVVPALMIKLPGIGIIEEGPGDPQAMIGCDRQHEYRRAPALLSGPMGGSRKDIGHLHLWRSSGSARELARNWSRNMWLAVRPSARWLTNKRI
jgi:hypothetical protein